MRVFLGIPFAAPPVGPLRWRPPQPVAPWTAPRDATRFGPACMQPDSGYPRKVSEDCLTLNLWVPGGAGPDAPVLVWIHGGAFYEGSGSDDIYEGTRLARRTGAIVVTINYRLGALGFLALPALAKEAGREASPSYGLLDQRAALAWLHRNVAAFGGDPARVTIFGGSAGAWNVCAHMASPGSRGLFARAIMESGSCSNTLYFSPADAEDQGARLAAAVGCTGPDRLACLRARPAAALVAALPMKRSLPLAPGVWWGPVVDGVELPRLPIDAMRAGDFAHVPFLVGWNRDEGILHTVGLHDVTTDELSGFIKTIFGFEPVGLVKARYVRPTAKAALTDIVTDGIFACSTRRAARAVSGHGVPVYVYRWTHALDDPKAHPLGATHSVELFFVWGQGSMGIGLSQRERALSDTIMDAWGAFARTGDPGTARRPWPRFTATRDQDLVLDLAPHVEAGADADVCRFWDGLERYRLGGLRGRVAPHSP